MGGEIERASPALDLMGLLGGEYEMEKIEGGEAGEVVVGWGIGRFGEGEAVGVKGGVDGGVEVLNVI
jgi:hypothetical protein